MDLWYDNDYSTAGKLMMTPLVIGPVTSSAVRKGVKTVGKAKYWQYFTKGWKNFKSKWFTKGVNGKLPYKLGKEAREALNLPKKNRGTAVKPYKPKKIVGPRHPKPQPDWDPPINKQGSGWEYYDGSEFPD
jgi:hypothetical protein